MSLCKKMKQKSLKKMHFGIVNLTAPFFSKKNQLEFKSKFSLNLKVNSA